MHDKPSFWGDTDFRMNKALWKLKPHSESLVFRMQNLQDLQQILSSRGVSNWLFGRTLADTLQFGFLMPDHDDDLMVESRSLEWVESKISQELTAAGFVVIRRRNDIISVHRFNRYVDIHPKAGYIRETTTHPTSVHGQSLFTNVESDRILAEHRQQPRGRGQSRPKALLAKWRSLQVRSGLSRAALVIARFLLHLFLERVEQALGRLKQRTRRPAKALSEDQFLALKIDADSALNWEWRKNHLDMLFEEGESLGASLLRLRRTGIPSESEVIETPLEKCIQEPIHLSRDFWKAGNNLFLYPFIYGFRHLVLPYSGTNSYISAGLRPMLFSRAYFEQLPIMRDDEIVRFLERNPLTVSNGALISGRHRAVAMLGRLYRGEKYLPVWVRR